MTKLKAILESISPEVLREMVAVPHDQMREEFTALFLSTSEHEEVLTELGRFVCHTRQKWLSIMEWPLDRGIGEAQRLLGREGVLGAVKACRHADRGGLRGVLDELTKRLQQDALIQYVNVKVLPLVHGLSFEDSLRLAEAYIAEFKDLSVELETPAVIVTRWTEVLHQHARLAVK